MNTSETNSESEKEPTYSPRSCRHPAELVFLSKKRRIKLKKEITTIGRQSSCDVVLKGDDSASRLHAEIKRISNGYVIYDKSYNGSLVNGERVKRSLLQDGDVLTLGKKSLTFYDRDSLEKIPQEEKNSRKVGTHEEILKALYREVSDRLDKID